MNNKKSSNRLGGSQNFPKNSSRYIPSQEQANIILNYFLHNNFQDFNTWQQISKSKCQFQYNETKNQHIQCKATLKWDDSSLPVLVQVSKSRNKKNAKKKALYKLVENLIFIGLIGYGFKDADFIKRLPKRRKQDSGDESDTSVRFYDQKIKQNIRNKNYDQCLSGISQKNVHSKIIKLQKILAMAIKNQNLLFFVKAIAKLQKLDNIEGEVDISYNILDVQNIEWQKFDQYFVINPYEHDLTQILKIRSQSDCKIKIDKKQAQQLQKSNKLSLQLPCFQLKASESKIPFQFFYPIDYTLIFRRTIQQARNQVREKSDYFIDFYKQIPLPLFESEDSTHPLHYKVIQKILNIILEFSYDFRLVINLLSIFERQVTRCNLEAIKQQENQKTYLKNMVMITAQFAYLLSKKINMLSLSIQGLINIESDAYLTFHSKQPEQIIAQKISKKTNTSEIQQMAEFANQQMVLLVSKIDPKVMFIAQIVQCWPTIRLKCLSFQSQLQHERLPFTMFKIMNAKIYNRLSKSILHFAKNKLSNIKNNTFIIYQRPTQPLITLICQLISEWIAINQTILIVSENFNQIFAILNEKGYKVAKIGLKVEQKMIMRKQIVCCSPIGVCSDAIKNYAFTRVIIQGAQKISQTLSTLALDKGFKKLYLIGDTSLPQSLVLSKFCKNRSMSKSLFAKFIQDGIQIVNFRQESELHLFDSSILRVLNNFFYTDRLNKNSIFQSPSIKGFIWPSQFQRIALVHVEQKNEVIEQVQMCSLIVASIIKTGFITINEIACRVTSTNLRALLSAHLYNMFKKYPQLGVNDDLGPKIVDFATGSKFKQKNLCIMLADSNNFNLQHFNAALQQSRRGLIVIANFLRLEKLQEWKQIMQYAKQKNIILQKIVQ